MLFRSGDGSRSCWGWVLAGCTPGRTLIGLRLPDRGKNPTPGDACERCARLPKPASACGLAAEFNIRSHSPVRAVSRSCRSLMNFTSGPVPVGGTQLINDRRARPVPESDVSSGNLGDRRFVDQVGAAGSPGSRCEIQQRPGTRWPHGEISHRDCGPSVALNFTSGPQADAGFGSRAQRSQASPGVGFFPRSWSLR